MERVQTEDRVARLREIVADCQLCPRRCRVDRLGGEVGACRVGAEAVVVSVGPHFGEEPTLVGRGGSGAIFFAGCNLACVFCQNYDISQSGKGQPVTADELAALAMELQRQGCENINFVTPTHVSHAVAEAIILARDQGLTVPTCYNCGGYESVETLRLLEGLIDIYMPDFKWADEDAALKYSGVADYPAVATVALKEMYRQVGPLEMDERDVATRGVLVRHLVLPGDVARSRDVVDIVAEAAPGGAINIMGQYRPAYRASEYPALTGHINGEGLLALREYAAAKGLLLVH